MNTGGAKPFKSHGDGTFSLSSFKKIGENVIFERGVLIFHPENIELGNNIYVGHNTTLKGYYKNQMVIRSNTWIGQHCFFHSAGGITIGEAVGIGPKVLILTSQHSPGDVDMPVLHSPLDFRAVTLEDGCDIGVASILLPGVTIGQGAIVGAGSIVTRSVPPFEIWAGNPARFIRKR